MRAMIGAYVEAKYNADKNLAKRTGFKWTILRPGGLTNEPGTGKAAVGRTHITPPISVSKSSYSQSSVILGVRRWTAGA